MRISPTLSQAPCCVPLCTVRERGKPWQAQSSSAWRGPPHTVTHSFLLHCSPSQTASTCSSRVAQNPFLDLKTDIISPCFLEDFFIIIIFLEVKLLINIVVAFVEPLLLRPHFLWFSSLHVMVWTRYLHRKVLGAPSVKWSQTVKSEAAKKRLCTCSSSYAKISHTNTLENFGTYQSCMEP